MIERHHLKVPEQLQLLRSKFCLVSSSIPSYAHLISLWVLMVLLQAMVRLAGCMSREGALQCQYPGVAVNRLNKGEVQTFSAMIKMIFFYAQARSY